MNTLLFNVMWMGALVLASTAREPGAGTAAQPPQPCYVVVAVDVSGGMESSDSPLSGPAGRGLTLRDEGQLVFLQLLPFLRSDLYVGVTHFADRVQYALPSPETGPLLPWGQTFLNESACRNLVKSAVVQVPWRADMVEGMNWAFERIQAARQKYGPGPAKLLVLSNGDPRANAREVERGRGPLLSAAKRFAGQQIRIYPILLDKVTQPSGGSLAVESLMQSIALMTGGRAYQLSQELGFADILLDVFDLGVRISGDLVVSPHDWAMVAVGPALESMTVEPAGGGDARTLALDDRLEAASGIRTRVIPWAGTRATVLRRPTAQDLVERYWQGRWWLASANEKTRPALRLYRIPEYLVQLEMTPALPWWLNEQVQVKAHLLERHPETSAGRTVPPVEGGGGLSWRMKARLAEGQSSFVVDQGHWTIPERSYETEPFAVRAPGLYQFVGELWHTIGDFNTPVMYVTADWYVHPECVGLEVVDAATNQVLLAAPATATRLPLDARGGQDVYLRISAQGEFKAEPLSGVVQLQPLPQSPWTLQKDDRGRLVTGPIRLIEQEDRLTGLVNVEVRTFAGIRHVRFPTFELTYTPAPLRLECAFADGREALWVGEVHRQPLTITAFPVFDNFLNQTLELFPESLSGTHLRTVNLRSGTLQTVSPEGRRLERPQPGEQGPRTVAATYFLESPVPIPPADKCEIDLSAALDNLQGAVRTYAVVDPVAKGLFEWIVQQGDEQRRGPVSETLFCGEPIRFYAEWRADQNVSAVRFEIPQGGAAGSLSVDLPVAAGANHASVQQIVAGLLPGEALPIYVHVTLQPAHVAQPLHVKLQGGQFRAADRRIVLDDLTLGDGTPADIPGFVWEPVDVPVQAVFQGYKPEDPAHNAVIEQFKKSCIVTVTSKDAKTKDISDTIEWTSVAPVAGAASRCRLAGHVTYIPETLGRAAIELNAQTPGVRGPTGSAARQAYVHILAKEPRLTVAVNRLKPGGEDLLFDSRSWVRGQSAGTPLTTRLSTRLRVDVQSADGTAAGPSRPWQATLKLLRRPAADADWITVFSETAELDANQSLTREVQIAENGQYALEVVGQDRQSTRRTAYVRTPVLASIQPHEVQAAMVPPVWLTSRVRQWPFEYLVTLHQDAVELSRPQALAFQFQLPGQSEVWLDGATSPVGPETAATRHLSAKAPRLLPASEHLRDGVARFRLSAQGLEVLRWECPNIRVIPPVLEGLAFSGKNAGTVLATNGGGLALDGSTDLWVRPQFRVAPELEGQWVPAETVVYLWRDPQGDSAGKPADVRILERLQEQESPPADGGTIRRFEIANEAGTEAANVLPRRSGHGFWGWPKKAVNEKYALVASVVYRPREASGSSGSSGTAPTVAEWSDVYAVPLNAPWVIPLCWWPVAAVLVMAAVVMVLRVLVPSPSRLALDMRLEENIAVVEPVRLDNPVLVDLRETSLAEEIVLYARYLCGRWSNAGRRLARQAGRGPESIVAGVLSRFLAVAAAVAAPLWVLLRRSLYPRRWAWAAIIPRIRGNAALVRTGLLCVWTGLGARRGRVWSSQAGSLALPDEGQTKSINLDFPYRIDSMDRTMRVTVRVRRMVAEEVRATAAN
jgi:hypothetical protein